MTNSIIAIKGNHLNQATEIFEAFRYVDLKQDFKFDSLDEMYNYSLSNYFDFSKRDITLRGIWFVDGWTMIFDPETIDFAEEEALTKVSAFLKSEVFTFVIQTTSNSFGFAKYHSSKIRSFFSSKGEVTENIGTPINEENGFNINSQIFVDDINGLANKLGIHLDQTSQQNFVVKQLGYNEELKQELEEFKLTQQLSVQSKPWWKFW